MPVGLLLWMVLCPMAAWAGWQTSFTEPTGNDCSVIVVEPCPPLNDLGWMRVFVFAEGQPNGDFRVDAMSLEGGGHHRPYFELPNVTEAANVSVCVQTFDVRGHTSGVCTMHPVTHVPTAFPSPTNGTFSLERDGETYRLQFTPEP